jgi:hypothetical protein
MATVGSSSAYAVRLLTSAAEIWFFRWRCLTIFCVWGRLARTDRNYCCAKKTLWPRLVISLPVAPRYVHPAHGFLNGWRRQALPRIATLYECVSSDVSYHFAER